MSNEQSSTESANTSTNTTQPTKTESTQPDVQNVQQEDTTKTLTRYKAEPSYSNEIKTPQEGLEQLTKTTSDGETKPTPAEAIALGRPPYIVDILDCRLAYETFNVSEQLGEIDEFIRADIPDDIHAYEAAVRGLLSHIKETDNVYSKVESLLEYVRLQQKIRGIIKEKEEFESTDPLEMDSKMLKKFLKQHGR